MKRKHRKVLVVGLGTFGRESAMSLTREGAEVLAFDTQHARVQAIGPLITRAVCGDARNEEVLDANGAFDADAAIVALGDHFDGAVLVTHLLARREVPEIHVQVDSEDQAAAIMMLGASSAIFPEKDMAARLAGNILHSNIGDLMPLGETFGVIEVPLPVYWFEKSLAELDVRKKHRVTVVAIRKRVGKKSRNRFEVDTPDPQERLTPGSQLFVMGSTSRLSTFRAMIDELEESAQSKKENAKPDDENP